MCSKTYAIVNGALCDRQGLKNKLKNVHGHFWNMQTCFLTLTHTLTGLACPIPLCLRRDNIATDTTVISPGNARGWFVANSDMCSVGSVTDRLQIHRGSNAAPSRVSHHRKVHDKGDHHVMLSLMTGGLANHQVDVWRHGLNAFFIRLPSLIVLDIVYFAASSMLWSWRFCCISLRHVHNNPSSFISWL